MFKESYVELQSLPENGSHALERLAPLIQIVKLLLLPVFTLPRLMLQLPEEMGLIAIALRQTKGRGEWVCVVTPLAIR